MDPLQAPSKPRGPLAVIFSLWPAVLLAPLVPFPAPSVLVGHPWKPELLLSLILAVTIVFLYLYQKRAVLFEWKNPLVLPIIAFIVWSGVSTLWAGSASSVIHHTLVWGEYLIFFIFALFSLTDRRIFRSTLYVLATVALIICINCTVEYLLRERIDATFGYRYGRYAEIWATLLPLFIALAMRSKGRILVLATAVTSFLWLAILFSTSRTSMASSLVGTGIFGLAVVVTKELRSQAKRFALIAAWLIILGFLAQVPSLIGTNEFKSSTLSRISTSAESDPSNSLSRNIRFLFLPVGLEMWSEHPIMGVGADNFGREFNKYRAVVSAKPGNQALAQGNEDAIPERAHNEYLQVATELGVIGIVLFSGFLISLAWGGFASIRGGTNSSNNIFKLAAASGMAAFLLSSCFSSYSFRLVQNGVVFFFLAAILVGKRIRSENSRSDSAKNKGFMAAGFALCIALAVFSSLKAASQYFANQGEASGEVSVAKANFRTAFQFDPSDAGANFTYASLMLNNFEYGEAARQYRDAIDNGIGTTATYSYLISAHSLNGDDPSALAAAAEAVAIFPYSPFLLTRYAVLLENTGRDTDAQAQFAKAQNINEKQAQTWRTVITRGAKKAAEAGRNGAGVPLLADLYPQDALYAVLAERQLKFPEERYKFAN